LPQTNGSNFLYWIKATAGALARSRGRDRRPLGDARAVARGAGSPRWTSDHSRPMSGGGHTTGLSCDKRAVVHFHGVSDQDLLAATSAGQATAFGEFFLRHQPAVARYVRHRVGSPEDAADLTAEVFAAALLMVHRGRVSHVVDGAPWLCGIARHKLIDSYRRGRVEDQARREAGLDPLRLSDSDVDALNRMDGLASPMYGALASLPREERVLILERVVLERDYQDIAARRGGTASAARKRVSRSLQRIRNEMRRAGRFGTEGE
jgi:RNA polymerase sigma factor (sigma-70 family)